MKRAIVWVLSIVGFAVVLWLLLSPPDSHSTVAECDSVLRSDWIPLHGEVEPHRVDGCQTGQTVRLGWALLIAMPTVVLSSIAVRRWHT